MSKGKEDGEAKLPKFKIGEGFGEWERQGNFDGINGIDGILEKGKAGEF